MHATYSTGGMLETTGDAYNYSIGGILETSKDANTHADWMQNYLECLRRHPQDANDSIGGMHDGNFVLKFLITSSLFQASLHWSIYDLVFSNPLLE